MMANALLTVVGFLAVSGGLISISIHKIEEGMYRSILPGGQPLEKSEGTLSVMMNMIKLERVAATCIAPHTIHACC